MGGEAPDLTKMMEMFDTVMDKVQERLAKPETAESCAAFVKNYYDALLEQGFNKEDALKIVTATGIPRLMPGGK